MFDEEMNSVERARIATRDKLYRDYLARYPTSADAKNVTNGNDFVGWMERQWLVALQTATLNSIDAISRGITVDQLDIDSYRIEAQLSQVFKVGEPDEIRVALGHQVEVDGEDVRCIDLLDQLADSSVATFNRALGGQMDLKAAKGQLREEFGRVRKALGLS